MHRLRCINAGSKRMPLGSGTPNSSVSRPQHGCRQNIIRVIRIVTITQRGNAVLCAPNDEGRVGRLQHHSNLALRPIGCRHRNAPEQRATQEATAQQHRTTRIRPGIRHLFGLRDQRYPVSLHTDDQGVPFPVVNVNATKRHTFSSTQRSVGTASSPSVLTMPLDTRPCTQGGLRSCRRVAIGGADEMLGRKE
ncbi:hypothetical protein ABIA45_007087 [Bradyrhizobium sp. USDA 336]